LLSDGFPQNFQHPPFIDSGFDNGQSGPNYRPFNSNRLPYAQQWNLTVEHQFTGNFYLDVAYVGNKGTRMPSATDPINALNPSLLSMGQQLFDVFQPGQTTLDGVSIPYSGWVDQMTACAPTVAQALSPYPQYCGGLTGETENAGNSTYHSLQVKAEKRFSNGFWFLGSYTNSKLITDSNSTQAGNEAGGLVQGVISPFERHRNKTLAIDDVPQLLSFTVVYDLPVGKGKRYLNVGGITNKILGGWEASTIFRASSGIPFIFRDSNCNVPAEFRVACLPAVVSGNPFAVSKGSFKPEPNVPLFNRAAFQDNGTEGFQFDYGSGAVVSNYRGYGFHNQDFGLTKDIRITERVGVQFKVEAFNLWNWHNFACMDQCTGNTGFVNDLASPSFGTWNGAVSPPRNIQMGMKVLF
jgi:hypothetical protein